MGYVHFRVLLNQNILKIDVKGKEFNHFFLVDEKWSKYHNIIWLGGYSMSSTITGLVFFFAGLPWRKMNEILASIPRVGLLSQKTQ